MTSADGAIGVGDVVRSLRRRLPTILVAVAACVAISLVVHARTDTVYQASTELLLDQPVSAPGFGVIKPPVDGVRARRNEERFVVSQRVRRAVREKLPDAEIRVNASGSTTTDVMTISARSDTAAGAAELANTYAETYLELTLQDRIESAATARRVLQNRIDDLARQIETAQGSERGLLINQRLDFLRRQESMALRTELLPRSRGTVLRPAFPPGSPTSPLLLRDLMIGVLTGLVIGAAAAVVRDQLDDRLTGMDDLLAATPGTPVLAAIPGAGRPGRPADLVRAVDSAPGEAYRALRTSLVHLAHDRGTRVVQVTSAARGEGRTSVAVNTAVALARAGESVAVLDADLRRPLLHEVFGIDGRVGLSSVLSGTAHLAEATIRVAVDGAELLVVPAGPVPPNASELLAGPRLETVLDGLRRDADIVIVDGPPVVGLSAALVLARATDATLLVARQGGSRSSQVRRAASALAGADATLAGTVLVDAAGRPSKPAPPAARPTAAALSTPSTPRT